jgi:predicted transcriptional regulator
LTTHLRYYGIVVQHAGARCELACYGAVVDDDVVNGRKVPSRLLGPLAVEVMQTLWEAGEPLTPRAVQDALNSRGRVPLAYTTVTTVMARLTERDVLRRTPAGRGYVYEPAVGDVAALAVRDVIRQHGEAAVTHFLREARADPRLRARLELLLAGDDPATGAGGP